MNTLEIKNVTYSYANSKEKALIMNQSFELVNSMQLLESLELESQHCFLALMAGLDKPNSGEILFNNEKYRKNRL